MSCIADRSGRCFILLMVLVAGSFCWGVALGGPPWEEEGILLTSDGSSGDGFGVSVAISGNLGVASASNYNSGQGAAYIFDVATGQQLFKLVSSDGTFGDVFGSSVAISSDYVIVGSPDDDDLGDESGSVYIFDVRTGQQLRKLVASDGASRDFFGSSVALSGNLAVIGALGDDDRGGESGSSYVFDILTGQQIHKLVASDGATGDEFGNSVSASGNQVIIGSIGSNDYVGSAYVFDINSGQELFKLVAPDGVGGDFFGVSVALSGNLAVVGANGDRFHGRNSGSAYVFDILTGQPLKKLVPIDRQSRNQFGISVALSGNIAVIGTPVDNNHTGSAYVFDVSTGQQLFKILASDGRPFDSFGQSVAVSGDTALVGSPYRSGSPGFTYVFKQRMTDYLKVFPRPLKAGQSGKISFVGGLPDSQTWLLYSVDGLGQTFIRELNVTIDLSNPKIAIGPVLTNENGDWQVVRRTPNAPHPIHVWFQIVQRENKTNVVATEMLP